MIGSVLAIMLAGMGQAGPDLDWQRYTNAKFGYSVCFPARLLRARRESDAGDGRSFNSVDGAEMKVWGEYASVSSATMLGEVTDIQRDLAGPRELVTYRVIHANWAVLSGRSGHGIFWAKVFQKDDRIIVLELVHPASALAQYSKVSAQLNRCLTVGSAPF